MSEAIRAEVLPDRPNVMIVTLDRPPVNAMTPDCYERLVEIFGGLQQRRDIHCVILTGAGDRAFCGGADTKQLHSRTIESTFDRSAASAGAFDAIRRSPAPVIGAINGPAIGVGCIMAACCDLLVAAEHATFGIPEVAIGVPAGIRHLNRLVPDRIGRLMAYTARRIDAIEMQRLGSIVELTPRGEVLAAAFRLADEIAAHPYLVTRMTKDAIALTEVLPFDDGYRVQQLYTTIAVAHAQAQKGEAGE